MINNPEPVLVVSNHKQMLNEMAQAKEKGDNEDFCKSFFIYLHKSKEKLERYLRKPDAQGCCRPEDHIEGVLKDYKELDKIFKRLADCTIDATDKDISQVVKKITALRSKLCA